MIFQWLPLTGGPLHPLPLLLGRLCTCTEAGVCVPVTGDGGRGAAKATVNHLYLSYRMIAKTTTVTAKITATTFTVPSACA